MFSFVLSKMYGQFFIDNPAREWPYKKVSLKLLRTHLFVREKVKASFTSFQINIIDKAKEFSNCKVD